MGIGNNVWIEFEHMDFADGGVTKLVMFGRSLTDRNTVRIRFSSPSGETPQVVEFHHSENFMEHEFDLEKVVGLNQVTFTFLPGSSFDFGWFQFMP